MELETVVEEMVPNPTPVSSSFTFKSKTVGLRSAVKACCPVMDKRFPKITLRVGADLTEIKANPVFLALGSPFFHKSISRINYDEEEPILLTQLDPAAVHLVIVFLYTGYIIIEENNAQRLLLVAKEFEISEVQKSCLEFLISNLNCKNYWDMRRFGTSNELQALSDSCDTFLTKHFKLMTDLPEFLALQFPEVERILHYICSSNRDTQQVNNLDILNAVLKWGRKEEDQRRQYLHSLVTAIDLGDIFDKDFIALREAFRGESTPLSQCLNCKLAFLELCEMKHLEKIHQSNSNAVNKTPLTSAELDSNSQTATPPPDSTPEGNENLDPFIIILEEDEDLIKMELELETTDSPRIVSVTSASSTSASVLPESLEITNSTNLDPETPPKRGKRKRNYNSHSALSTELDLSATPDSSENLAGTGDKLRPRRKSVLDLQSTTTPERDGIRDSETPTRPTYQLPSPQIADYFSNNSLVFYNTLESKPDGKLSIRKELYEYSFKTKTVKLMGRKLTPRESSTLIHHRSIIYDIGGQSEDCGNLTLYNTMNMYMRDCKKKLGRLGPPMLEPRSDFGSCVCRGYIYVVGGLGTDGVDGSATDGVERFSLSPTFNDSVWEKLPTMDSCRISAGVVAHRDKIYAIGGFYCKDGTRVTHSTPSVEIFDPNLLTWTYLEEMKKGRGLVQPVVLNEMIYAVGGEETIPVIKRTKRGTGHENTKKKRVRDVEMYNPVRDVWTSCKPLIRPRSCGVVVAKDGLIFAIGGDDDPDYKFSKSVVEVYDPRVDAWSEMDWPAGLKEDSYLYTAIVLDT